MGWFRLHDSMIDNPKIQRLSADLKWAWIECLAVANRQGDRGTLPGLSELAFYLRTTEEAVKERIKALMDAGLVERNGSRYVIHDWDEHQFNTDASTQRWRKWRDKRRANVGANVGPALAHGTETEPPLPPVTGGTATRTRNPPDEPPLAFVAPSRDLSHIPPTDRHLYVHPQRPKPCASETTARD